MAARSGVGRAALALLALALLACSPQLAQAQTCTEDSECNGGAGKCCNGVCVTLDGGAYGANCCGSSSPTTCLDDLVCSTTSGPGVCRCRPGQEPDAESGTCVPCPPGYYSTDGTQCQKCDLDKFSPAWGWAQCVACPVGSEALDDNDAVGQQGSTSCLPCKPGTYSKSTTVGSDTYRICEPCADGYYRPGFASPTNNDCIKIPDGRKEKSRSTTQYDRAEIVLCDKGEVSIWNGGTRTPSNPELCTACTDANYAQRIGMKACAVCPRGTAATKSSESLPGNDQCTPCTGNTYRNATDTTGKCTVCNAGGETSPSGNTLCVPCDAGYYMPDNAGGTSTSLPANGSTCLPCPVNTYQPSTGATGCINCPAGSSTQDVGNAQCSPCPVGYYSPSAAVPCVGAPAGTFINVTGSKLFTACPKGTFSNEVGASECEPCAAGQYNNIEGGRICKSCPAGTYSNGGGAPTCKQCNAGFYSAPGSGYCSPCKPGFFASGNRSANCAACPRGHQCPTIATRSPQACPRGYYSNRDGLRLCLPCAVNMYSNSTKATSCVMCPQGYSTRGLTGQSTCQPLARTGRRLQL